MKVSHSRMKIRGSVDTNERKEEEDKSGWSLKSVKVEEECDWRGAKEEGCMFRWKVDGDAVRGYRIKREAAGEEEGERRKCQGELRREKAARRSGWSLWVEPRVREAPAKTGLQTPPPRSR